MSKLRQVVTKGGVVLVTGSIALMGFLSTWEDDKRDPGKVYADQVARGVPTVCSGITPATSPYPVIVGDYWSEERCLEVNRLVVGKTQLKLADCLTGMVLSQNTFDALSSHAHNVGVGNTCASRAVGLINAGLLLEGCRALAYTPGGAPNWSFVGDKFIQGLFNRRKAEAQMCALKDSP